MRLIGRPFMAQPGPKRRALRGQQEHQTGSVEEVALAVLKSL